MNPLYRLATYGLGALSLVLALWLASSVVGKGRAERSRDEAMQALDGAMADLGRCQANRRSLTASISAQNAALDAKAAADAERLAKAEKAVREAGKDREAAQVRAARLLRPVAGADVCARMVAADELIMGTAR